MGTINNVTPMREGIINFNRLLLLFFCLLVNSLINIEFPPYMYKYKVNLSNTCKLYKLIYKKSIVSKELI